MPPLITFFFVFFVECRLLQHLDPNPLQIQGRGVFFCRWVWMYIGPPAVFTFNTRFRRIRGPLSAVNKYEFAANPRQRRLRGSPKLSRGLCQITVLRNALLFDMEAMRYKPCYLHFRPIPEAIYDRRGFFFFLDPKNGAMQSASVAGCQCALVKFQAVVVCFFSAHHLY